MCVCLCVCVHTCGPCDEYLMDPFNLEIHVLLFVFPWRLRWQRICHQLQGTRVKTLGWEDLLQKDMATHSSVLAWRTLWTEPGGPQSTGSQKAWGNFFFYNTLTFPCLSCYSSLLLKLHWLEPSSILSYHFLLTSSVFGLRKACFSIFQIFFLKAIMF